MDIDKINQSNLIIKTAIDQWEKIMEKYCGLFLEDKFKILRELIERLNYKLCFVNKLIAGQKIGEVDNSFNIELNKRNAAKITQIIDNYLYSMWGMFRQCYRDNRS